MAGIDYGMGVTNIDIETGIRYGVISQHSLASWFYDHWEADYGEPHCPKCNREAKSSTDDTASNEGWDGAEWFEDKHFYCANCRYCFWSDEAYGDAPIGHSLDLDGIKAIDCLDSDVMVLESPFYTYAPFCSPCVPGAGNLDAIADTRIDAISGVKTYCFDHTWFEDGKAPYRVFRVSDDVEVHPE